MPEPARPSSASDQHWTDRLACWWREPNPVWVREMRQSVRLTRTPLILALVTILTALLISAVGGVGASNADPATVGAILFHTFFSMAFAIVSWVGPGVAALTIASERSGRTWETVLLTPMTARQVARGKFAAAYTYVGMYVVMLAPVGALSFLFGGVSALDVTLAFVLLFVFCALAVGFGLSISSAVPNPTVAMLVTVPLAAVLSLGIYLGLGVGLSLVAHRYWPGIIEGAPVWLPTAYTRAEFGWLYVLLLVYAPFSLWAVASTFFYELTAANIAQPNDDRSSGLRRWFWIATPVLIGSFLVPRAVETDRDEIWKAMVIAMAATQTFLGMILFVFAGEPLSRSRRVEHEFKRASHPRLRRFFGPGIEPAMLSVLLVGGIAQVALTGMGMLEEHRTRLISGALDLARVACVLSFGGYALCFLLFLTGFMLFIRARSASGSIPRLMLVLVVLFANGGPWLLLAMAGMMARIEEVLWLASPAPSFVFQVFDSLINAHPDSSRLLTALVASASGWALLGVAFWTLGSRALRKQLLAERTERRVPQGTPTPSTTE